MHEWWVCLLTTPRTRVGSRARGRPPYSIGSRTGGSVWQTTVVVGVPDGLSAYVFVAPPGESPYVLQANLRSPFVGAAAFGRSVAVHSNSVVVGDPEQSNFFGLGTVHVFVRSGTAWSHQQEILTPTNVVSFGSSVAIEDNVAAIGAPLSDPSGQLQPGFGVHLQALRHELARCSLLWYPCQRRPSHRSIWVLRRCFPGHCCDWCAFQQ
jgi:hypothetical protein